MWKKSATMHWRSLWKYPPFRIAAVVTVAMLICAALFTALAQITMGSLLWHGARTTASMVNSQPYKSHDGTTHYALLVAFADTYGQQQRRWISDLNAGDIPKSSSKPIAIVYDPGDPSRLNLADRVTIVRVLFGFGIGVPLAIAVVALVVTAWRGAVRPSLLRRGVAVVGSVTGHTLCNGGSGNAQSECYELEYAWPTPTGFTRRGTARLSAEDWNRYEVGSPITVVYDPRTLESAVDTLGLRTPTEPAQPGQHVNRVSAAALPIAASARSTQGKSALLYRQHCSMYIRSRFGGNTSMSWLTRFEIHTDRVLIRGPLYHVTVRFTELDYVTPMRYQLNSFRPEQRSLQLVHHARAPKIIALLCKPAEEAEIVALLGELGIPYREP